jgi:hypothetical protein
VAALAAGGALTAAAAGCAHPRAEHFHGVSTTGADAVPDHEDPAGLEDHPAGFAAAGSYGPTGDGGGEKHHKSCCQLHVSCCVTALMIPGGVSIRPSDEGSKMNPWFDEVPAGHNTVPPLRPPRAAA